MILNIETHARIQAGGVQNTQQFNERRMLSLKECILFKFKKKRGGCYLVSTGSDVL